MKGNPKKTLILLPLFNIHQIPFKIEGTNYFNEDYWVS